MRSKVDSDILTVDMITSLLKKSVDDYPTCQTVIQSKVVLQCLSFSIILSIVSV